MSDESLKQIITREDLRLCIKAWLELYGSPDRHPGGEPFTRLSPKVYDDTFDHLIATMVNAGCDETYCRGQIPALYLIEALTPGKKASAEWIRGIKRAWERSLDRRWPWKGDHKRAAEVPKNLPPPVEKKELPEIEDKDRIPVTLYEEMEGDLLSGMDEE